MSKRRWPLEEIRSQKVKRRGDLEKEHRTIRKETNRGTHKRSGQKREERRVELTCSKTAPFCTAIASLVWGG